MADERAYSKGNIRLYWVPAGGINDVNAPTVLELTSGVKLSEAISWQDYDLGNDASEDIDNSTIMDIGISNMRGAAQFGGTLTFYRPEDPSDPNDPSAVAFQTFKQGREYGYLVALYLQDTPGEYNDPVAGDDVSLYYMIADVWADDTEGDDPTKFTITFQPQGQLAVFTKVAGAALTTTPATLTGTVGDIAKITTTVGSGVNTSANVSNGAVYTVTDPSVVSVSKHGVVSYLDTGTATINVTYPGATGSGAVSVTVS